MKQSRRTGALRYFDPAASQVGLIQSRKKKELAAYEKLEEELNKAEIEEENLQRALVAIQNINPDPRAIEYLSSAENLEANRDIKIHDEKPAGQDVTLGPKMVLQDESEQVSGMDQVELLHREADSIQSMRQIEAPSREEPTPDIDDAESKNTEAIIREVSHGVFGLGSPVAQEAPNADDLFFPTEVETGTEQVPSLADIQPRPLASHTEHAVSQSQLELQKQKNNQVVSRQLAIVNQQDKYLDLDAKILENYNRQIRDKGWTRERRTAAKMPPSVLFGLQKSSDNASQGTAATRSGAHSLNQPSFSKNRGKDASGLPKMASAA